jgi:hypothetical protein
MKKLINKVKENTVRGMVKIQTILADKRGEGFVDTAIFCVED